MCAVMLPSDVFGGDSVEERVTRSKDLVRKSHATLDRIGRAPPDREDASGPDGEAGETQPAKNRSVEARRAGVLPGTGPWSTNRSGQERADRTRAYSTAIPLS